MQLMVSQWYIVQPVIVIICIIQGRCVRRIAVAYYSSLLKLHHLHNQARRNNAIILRIASR